MAINDLNFQLRTEASIQNLKNQIGQLATTVNELKSQGPGNLSVQPIVKPENVTLSSRKTIQDLQEQQLIDEDLSATASASDCSPTRSVTVSNISTGTTEQDLKEFLTFPGKIEYIEMKSDCDSFSSNVAYVTFSNSEGAETAVLLSGAVVCGQSITIDLAQDYVLPASAASEAEATETRNAETGGLRKAEDVVSSMLAKGFVLGKDALNRAKAFDEKHQLTSTATAKVVSLDQKVGLSEKISAGTVLVNDKVKEMDERFQVSEKTKSAISAAEQSVTNAGSAIMKNRYVLTGATWVLGAYNRVTKAAEEVGNKTKEKVLAQDDDHVHATSQPSKPESPHATTPDQPSKPAPPQGLIL
ncbi:binding partner of ACD11 1-like [Abrus precatorius]|uniref:Binding partner of ACD11 1-like n=1 Tax=Abrus precatorius TaxID=3816 RepID=A0A8B8LPF1_ABRPR|nr:binding partner of ACD11 1-like [Abrus precatorius]